MNSKLGQGVARAGAIAMASIFLSRILGLVRDAVINGMFGQNEMTGAYTTAFRIPDLIFYLVAGGALSSAFIPVFSEKLAEGEEEEAWKIFSSIACIMLAVVTLLVILLMVFTPQVTYLLASERSHETQEAITAMGRILLPAQICFFMGSLMFATLYSKGEYSVPGLGPNLYNIGIILGAVVISHYVDPKVSGMCWGALAGAFVGNVLVPMWALPRSGVRFTPAFDFRNPGVKRVFQLMLPVVLGLSLPSVFMIILNKFANGYSGAIVTALDNANKVNMVPLGVFGMGLALAVFPKLSESWASKDLDTFKRLLSTTLNTTTYLAVPCSALFLFIPDHIIRALFERGAFTATETMRTAPLLQAFAVGLLFWCFQPSLMRAFYSTQDTKTPVVLGTICTLTFAGLCWLVQILHLDPVYLSGAASLAALLLVILMLAAIGKRLNGFDIRDIIVPFLKSSLAAAVLGVAAWGAFWVYGRMGGPGGRLGHFLWLSGSFLASTWIYYGVTKVLGMKEAAIVDRAVNRMSRRRRPKEGGSEDDGLGDE